MKYFQTTDLTPAELQERINSADTQEEIIKKFFNAHSTQKFTASDLDRELKKEGLLSDYVPITSIRRALSVLAKDGWINRLDEYKKGPFKVNEHFYQLSTGWGRAGYSEQHPINLFDKEAYDGQGQND